MHLRDISVHASVFVQVRRGCTKSVSESGRRHKNARERMSLNRSSKTAEFVKAGWMREPRMVCADRECPLVGTESVRLCGQKHVRTSLAGQESLH